MKMGDIQSLVTLHVKAKTWDEVCHAIIINVINVIITNIPVPSMLLMACKKSRYCCGNSQNFA